jgi:hypothetical protein
MMLKVLFYSYLTGTMSSRGMWEGLKNRADYIFLSGDQVPDFRTLNRFRSRHLKELPGLFAQIVHLCTKLGMIDFKYLAIDGQKIQADASWRRSKTKKRLERSMKKVTEGMRKLLEKEVSEDFSQEAKQKRLAERKYSVNPCLPSLRGRKIHFGAGHTCRIQLHFGCGGGELRETC